MHPIKVRSEGFSSYRLVYHRKFKTSIPIFVSIVKEDQTSSSSVALGPYHLIWTSVTFHLGVISPTGSSPLSHAYLCAYTVSHSRVFLPTDGSFSFLLPCFFPSTQTLPPPRAPLRAAHSRSKTKHCSSDEIPHGSAHANVTRPIHEGLETALLVD